jgi:hypothetical protein
MQSSNKSSLLKPAISPAVLLAASLAVEPQLLAQMNMVPTRPSDARPFLENVGSQWGTEYTNWVEVSAGGFILDGRKGELRRRYDLPATAFGGVESLHWETGFTNAAMKNWRLAIDGRGIFDNHDYLLKFDLRKENFGYVTAGYREYRTWYDRHGGFSPLGNTWVTPFDPQGAIDRGEIFVEGGLTIPNVPKFTFGYTHQFREGSKDSTIWGDINVVGTTTRNLVPSYWDIDEHRDIFKADMSHSVGNTGFGLGIRYDMDSMDNKRNMVREAPLAGTRALTQKYQVDTDLFNVHAFTESHFKDDKILLTSGYSFTTLDTDTGGSRIYGSDFDAVFDPLFARRRARDEGFLDLKGGATAKQYVANLNLLYKPFDTFTILPSVRVEKWEESGHSDFTETAVGTTAALVTASDELVTANRWNYLDVTESIEARYTGLKNWSFYARGEWLEGDSVINEQEYTPAGVLEVFRDTDADRFTQKYSVGANWYPLQRMNLAVQYYHKTRDNNYENNGLSTSPALTSGDRYPGYIRSQGFDSDDVNFRITVRPMMNLSFITRYDFQLNRIDTEVPILGDKESANQASHIFSETVSYTPFSWLYLQGNLNYAIDSTHTPAQNATGGGARLVTISENNYWNAGALAGFTISPKTDFQAQYSYYRAADYINNSTVSQPYGTSAEENAITGTIIQRLSKALRLTLKYGYFTYHDKAYGSRLDYNAHLVYTSLQYRF